MAKIRMMKNEAAIPDIIDIDDVFTATYEVKAGKLILDVMMMLPGDDIGASHAATVDTPFTKENISAALQHCALRAISAYIEKMLAHADPANQSATADVGSQAERAMRTLGHIGRFNAAGAKILASLNGKS